MKKPILTIMTFHLKAKGEPVSFGENRKKKIERQAKREAKRLGEKVSEGRVLRDLIDNSLD